MTTDLSPSAADPGSEEKAREVFSGLPWTAQLPPAAAALLDSAWKRFLPAPPASLLVQGPDQEEVAQWLTHRGFAPRFLDASRELPPTSLADKDKAQEKAKAEGDGKDAAAVCFLPLEAETDGPSFAAAWKERLGSKGRLLVVGLFRPGPSDRPGTLANLELGLAEGGFALRPAEELTLAPGPEGSTFAVLRCRRDPFTLRRYQEGDEELIAELFERSFHHQRGTDHWRWEYQLCPWGGPRVSLALDPKGALVAHYAGYPVGFVRQQGDHLERFIGHQLGDTMTAPDVRHVGHGPTSLLGRTSRHFFAAYSTAQVPFNYGFNVGNIQRFSMKILGARRVASVPFRRRPLDRALPAFRNLSRWRRWTGTKIVAVEKPGPAFDQFLERVAPAYGFLVERTSRYLRWRYFARPGFHYRLWAAFRRGRLCGWLVCRRQEEVLLWGDLLLDPDHEDLLEPLLAAALAAPEGEGAKAVEAWFPAHPAWLGRRLDALGFALEPHPQALALMCLLFQDPQAEKALREELYYTLGDSDLF